MSPTLRLLARRSAAFSQTRSFQTYRALNAGKESQLHNENRAEEAEAAKQSQIKKAKEGKGEWHEELGSDSESIVKADRGETGHNAHNDIQQLQKQSEKLAKKKQ